jgi:hypothetical protein
MFRVVFFPYIPQWQFPFFFFLLGTFLRCGYLW